MEHIQRIGGPDVVVMKMHELKRKYEILEAKKEDIERELEYEITRSCQKRPRKEVENWIANVRRAKPQVEELERQVLGSWYLCRLLLEGKVDNLVREVHELRAESKFERGLTLETYDNHGVAFLTGRLIGEAFEKNKKMIFDRLLGEEDSIVGVYGMGGVGKTTLVTHIHNELLRRPNINVSWVTVSQNSSTQKLQGNIAKIISLDISGEDDVRLRAAKLSEGLKRRKNLILILDDVWEDISLMDVGICVGENVRKLVLTTRSLTVCRTLNCERPIKVEPLREEESWMLFGETLNNDALLSDHRINETAKSLVRECDGLPLGIVVLAGSMRGVDDVSEWSNALREIKEAKYGSSDDMGFYDGVFLVLKYSYDRLKDPKLQECLLYCCLFPEDSKIDRDDLIEYFIDEKLIDGRNGKRQTFEKGHTILNKLENVCLLDAQKDELGKRSVKMHDLVRDMAIKIASDRPSRFWVHAGTGLQDCSHEEMWSDDLSRASLINNNITCISSNASPRCPALTTLLVHDNRELCVLSDGIFEHMKKLSVLNLSQTGITSLPSSISSMKTLAALLLQGCLMLKYVPSLENLTALRRLDLSGTSIDDVPKGVEKLIYLKHLNLGECRNLKTIPEGMLPQLYRLELFHSGFPLRLRGGDVGSLKKLETFHGNFRNFDEFNTCLGLWNEKRPKEYAVSVGCIHYIMNLLALNRRLPVLSRGSSLDYEVDKSLVFDRKVHIVCREETESAFSLLHHDTQFLNLVNCNGVTSLSHAANSIDLIACHVHNCFSMRHVICSCCGGVPFFENLKRLELQCLPELTDIVERGNRNPYPNTFSSLKLLDIRHCDKLTRLFVVPMLTALRRLEAVVVKECKELVEIVGDNEEETETAFPNLKVVKLEGLPKLKSFCGTGSLKLSDSTERIQIMQCPELKRLTLLWDEPFSPTSLEEITVEREWWNSAEWKHSETEALLRRFVIFHG